MMGNPPATFLIVTLAAVFASAPLRADDVRTQADRLVGDYAQALAPGDAPSLLTLFAEPDAAVRERVNRELADLRRYTDLAADARVLLAAQAEHRALVRWTLSLTGRLPRGDGTRYLIRTAIRDTLIVQTPDGWRFGREQWPQPDPEGDVRSALAVAQALEAPLVLACAFERLGGRWRPLGATIWIGSLGAPTGGGTDLAATVRQLAEALRAPDPQPGGAALHLFAVKRDGSWRVAPALWRGMPYPVDDARLASLGAKVEADFANGAEHEALGAAYLEARLPDWALEEYEKAQSLQPSAERAERIRQLRALAPDARESTPFAPDIAAARRLLKRHQLLTRAPSILFAAKPSGLLLADIALLRVEPDDPHATTALAAIEATHRRLTDEFDLSLAPVEVCVFPTREQYLAFRQLRGEAAVPEWSGGTSGPDGILTYSRPGVDASIAHEYAHAALDQLAGGAAIPKWLTEGFATLIEGAPADFESHLQRAYREGALLPLAQLCSGWAGLSEPQAAAAYVESRGVVEYVLDQYGADRFRQLVRALARSRDPDDALRSVLRLTMSDLQSSWLQHHFPST